MGLSGVVEKILGAAAVFFQAAAIDLDGTITSGDQLSAEAVDAIDQIRRNDLIVVLVTGQIGAELVAEFGQIADHVDALVLENGAVTVGT